MLGKDHVLETVRQETAILKHLVGKVQPKQWDWKPSANQRSNLELARYLAATAISTTTFLLTGSWDGSKAHGDAAAKATPAELPKLLDAQQAAIEKLLADANDADMAKREVTMPWGVTTKVLPGLFNMPAKHLVAYRMAFFIQIKASGCSELNTSNCWRGQDAAPAAAAKKA